MSPERASYLKTVVSCAAAGTLLAALALVGLVRGELGVAGRAVLSDAVPIIWLPSLGILAVGAIFFLLVALGGTICVLRDAAEKRRG